MGENFEKETQHTSRRRREIKERREQKEWNERKERREGLLSTDTGQRHAWTMAGKKGRLSVRVTSSPR